MPMNHSEDFNIFEILSAGDKELVHSSIFKELLTHPATKEAFAKLLGITLNSLNKDTVHIESPFSFDIVANGKEIQKKLRFDLLIGEKRYFNAVIENKFKAIPTKSQLELYDQFFQAPGSLGFSPGIKKVLIVFSLDIIPSSVVKYADENNWNIVPYVNYSNDHKDSIMGFVQDAINMVDPEQYPKFRFLLIEYLEFLKPLYEGLQKIIQSNRLEFNSLPAANSRFHLRNYICYLLTEVQKRIPESDVYLTEWHVHSDGGANTTPCASLHRTFQYEEISVLFFEFQGSTLKCGFCFNPDSEASRIVTLKKQLFDFVDNTLKNKGYKILGVKIPIKPKEQVKQGSATSMAFSFNLGNNEMNYSVSKDEVLDEISKLLTEVEGWAKSMLSANQETRK